MVLTESLKKIEIENGLILEFGVYKGQTINYIAKNLNKTQKNHITSFIQKCDSLVKKIEKLLENNF